MYRTKVYNKLYNDLLIPILDTLGLVVKQNKDGYNVIQWLGEMTKNERGELVPIYLTNPNNDDKIYTLINSQDDFLRFKNVKEEMEYFNPFVRYKNALTLLLMFVPHVYNTIYEMGDDDDNLASMIVDDDVSVSKDEIFRKIAIKQYPVSKDQFDVTWYKYSMEYESPTNPSLREEVSAVSSVKIVAVLMLICKIMNLYEDTPRIITEQFDGKFDDFQQYLEELLEKYVKERELNRKDLKKIKQDTPEDMDLAINSEELDLFANADVEDVLNTSETDDNSNQNTFEETERTKVINLSNEFRDTIPISFKDTDDDMMMLDFS